jgi:hypothetical protein
MNMYQSLLVTHSGMKFAPWSHLAPEGPALIGFMCGNTHHPGCLTRDEGVRIHSCEKGTYCRTVKESPVVWIRPIITRLPDGQDVAEVGVGGGGDDLEREAELDYLTPEDVESLLDAWVLLLSLSCFSAVVTHLTRRLGSATSTMSQKMCGNRLVRSCSAPSPTVERCSLIWIEPLSETITRQT